jgi:hypothetical protein
MSKTKIVITALLVIVVGTTLMHAQASRTWVSSTGDDGNPCTRTLPCKTFDGAIFKTAAAGEVDVLDPGSYGSFTITKPITIDGGSGQVASILASATDGIVVQAGASDTVVLRNLSLQGSGTGTNGIRFLSGKTLLIENCAINGFSNNGIDIALSASGQAHISKTTIENIGQVGIKATTTSGIAPVDIVDSKVIFANIGAEASDHSRMTVTRSTLNYEGSVGVMADSPTGDSVVVIKDSEICFNGSGVKSSGASSGTSSPQTTSIFVSASKIAFNDVAFDADATNPGKSTTFQNNEVVGNKNPNKLAPILGTLM